ncbi:hypothetical protein Tco_1050249 [Tanacetum coccineum]
MGLGIALGPRYEVGESSAAAAARPARGLRADYGFVATMDREIRRDPERYGAPLYRYRVGAHMREFRSLDRRTHAHTRHLMETEAGMSREAWGRAMDASDLAHGEVISLRTIVHAQMSKITELQSADLRRQRAMSDLLKTDRRRHTTERDDSTSGTGHHTTRAGDSLTGTGDDITGAGYCITGTAGTPGVPAPPELQRRQIEHFTGVMNLTLVIIDNVIRVMIFMKSNGYCIFL